jgi:nitroimidazol reductase NimA-like FMN-containing flavoprotein (pyridoxamine 5'-phosphate oxidase superfamily)
MANNVTTELVWDVINQELFAVLGMVTRSDQARTIGIVYIVRDQKLYIGTGMETWKARHVSKNPDVSITVPIVKRIPIMPWIKVPQATITFSGTARIIPCPEAPHELNQAVFRHYADDKEFMEDNCLIEVTPEGDFITYGIGIPLMQMRHPHIARGRAPVNAS